MTDEVKDRRALLEAAFDEAEKDEKVEENESANVEEKGSGKTESNDAGALDDADIDGEKRSRDDTKEEKREKPAADETQRQETEAANRSGQEPPVTDRAPNSWKPAARESWGKIPPEARAEIKRLDIEIQRTMSQTAQVRKFANDFAQVVNPYSHLIRAQNSTPLKAVQNLMQTAAGLMQGNPQQKAAIVAEIMQNYGVDIRVLDDYLTNNWDNDSGKLKNSGFQRQEAPPAWAQPLFAMQQQIQENMQQQNQRLQEEADAEIEKLKNQPFFEDLRDDIADIMEIAANRGRKMTLDEAYMKALKLNPEISKIMDDRQRAAETKAKLARAKKAASTISGGPGGRAVGNSGGDGKKSRREALSEAWENATDR